MKSQSSAPLLLRLLKNAEGRPVSGEEISRRLGTTRSAIWKQIEELREAGYRIDASPHLGYRFISAPDRLIPDELCDGLKTSVIGRQIHCYKTLDSTNRLALELGAAGYPEGAVVFAEEQTRGRGRLGRAWVSPKGRGLYFSVLLRPRMELREIPKITLTAAVAVAEAIGHENGLRVSVRWPNDLLIGDEKICGILTEMNAEADRLLYVVVGIGVNVNTPKKYLPRGATSLKEASGRTSSRCALARAIMENLERTYHLLLRGGFADIAAAWEEASAITGHRVAVTTLSGTLEGTATGIDEDGALWIRQDSGLRTRFLSGDIVFLR